MEKQKYKTRRLEEYKISKEEHQEIHKLLKRSFTEYPEGKSYFKQVPGFRYLIYHHKKMIGHMAVEYRMINIANENTPVFGVSDLCVCPEYQSQNIASTLLQKLDKKAESGSDIPMAPIAVE